MSNATAGNGGTVKVGGLSLQVIKWSRRPANKKQEITNSGSGGWVEFVGVLKGWTGTMTVIWDSTSLPYDAGIIMNAVVALQLYLGSSGIGPSGNALLDGPGEEVDNQNGVVTYELPWTSTGVWTEPG